MALFDWFRKSKRDHRQSPRYAQELRVAAACFPDSPTKARAMQRALRHVSGNVLQRIDDILIQHPEYALSVIDLFNGYLKRGRKQAMRRYGDCSLFTLATIIPVFEALIPDDDSGASISGVKMHTTLKTSVAALVTLNLVPVMGDTKYVSDDAEHHRLAGQMFVTLLQFDDPENMLLPFGYKVLISEEALKLHSPDDMRWMGMNMDKLLDIAPILHERSITTRKDMEPLLAVQSLPLVDGQL